MKKLYNEFFYVPKHGKIRDKVMLARVALTTVLMIVCLIAMSVSAYACFSCNITSGFNTITAANFEIDVTVTASNNKPVNVVKQDGKTYTAALTANQTYDVTLTRVGTAQTGFCAISVAGGEVDMYHTRQLGTDANDPAAGGSDTFTFQLRVTADTTVTFCAHWGTSSHYADFVSNGDEDERYITDGDGVIEITVNSPAPSTDRSEEKGGSTTANDQPAVSTTPSTDRTDTASSGEQTTADTVQQTTTTALVSSTVTTKTEASATTSTELTDSSTTPASVTKSSGTTDE